MPILRNLIESRASLESPLRPLTASSLMELFWPGAKTGSGVSVNEVSAMKFIAVYRAVTLVSGAIATLPLEAHKIGPKREPFRFTLMENPHPDMTRMELIETGMAHMLLWGDMYLERTDNAAGVTVQLEPLPPSAVTPQRVEPSVAHPTGKRFKVRMSDGSDEYRSTRQILHIPGPGYNGLNGLSPIGAAREGIGLGLAAQEYGSKLFSNGSLASGFLTTDQRLDEPAAKSLKTRWQQRIGGLEHAHEVAILDSGAKFQSLSIPPEDAQFIQSRKFQVEEVARLYGIPLHLLSDTEKSTSWGTGIEQQSIGFVVYTLMPWITRVEQRISAALLPRGIEAHFHTDSLMRGDAKTRYEAHATAVQWGLRSRNDIRLREGDAPVTGGDRFMIPANFSVLDDDGLPIPSATAPQPAQPVEAP